MHPFLTAAATVVLASLASAQVPTTGLRLWLRSDAGVVTSQGLVDSWTDQSGGNHTFAQSGAARPELLVDSAGGRLLRFQGGDFVVGSLPFTLQQATILALFRYRGPSGNDYLYSFGSSGSSGSQMTLSRRSSARAYHFDGSRQNIAGRIPESQWVVSTQLYGETGVGSHELRIDGVTQITSTATAYSVDFATARVGNWSSGGFTFLGDVAQILVYDRVLSAAEIQTVETWLHGRIAGPRTMTYGSGCTGSAGVPQLGADGASLPGLGSSFAVRTTNVPAAAPVFVLVGFTDTAFGGGPALPLALTSVGLPQCSVYVSGDVVETAANGGAGSATWSLPIPNDAALRRVCFHLQNVLFDLGANPTGVTLSNALTATIDA